MKRFPQKEELSMDINHISVSRKKCFDKCAAQYKFKYHLKVETNLEEPFHFTYGKLVHKIAEEYVLRKGESSVGEIATEVMRGKIELEPGVFAPKTLPKEYQTKFKRHQRAIQNLTDRIGYDGIVEHPFRFDLDPPNDRSIVGFIDRLIIKNDKAFIIDYKTTKKGKWRVNKQTVKTDLQLRVYARVVQKEFGIPAENIRAALFYLEGENLIAATYSDASLRLIEADMLDTFKEIEMSDPDKAWGRVGYHCKFCDFREVCPFFKSSAFTEKKADAWDGDMSKLFGN